MTSGELTIAPPPPLVNGKGPPYTGVVALATAALLALAGAAAASPVIESSTPPRASAGKSFLAANQACGDRGRAPNSVIVTLRGRGLKGTTLEVAHDGFDGKPGIEVKSSQISDKIATIVLNVLPNAEPGRALLTLSGPRGSASAPLEIVLSGTQYLERRFADSKPRVCFYGEFPGPAPNKALVDAELSLLQALAVVQMPAYLALGFDVAIYERSLWERTRAQNCRGHDRTGIVGCSPYSQPRVYLTLASPEQVGRTLLHEAAHKLHYSKVGLYEYIGRRAAFPASSFTQDWANAYGRVDERSCTHLPLTGGAWRVDHRNTPRCGFARAYGASGWAQTTLIRRHLEDVATMTEALVFDRRGLLTAGDGATDPRYKAKENVLRLHGFLPTGR